MDNTILRKVQLTQLEIYKQVNDIAQKNHIQVYLYAGTLLGAVRHQGFIPWDDDLDIAVPREEYAHLMECLQTELSEAYWLQNYETDPQYWQPFAKVRKKGTLFKEAALENVEDSKCGIWIDIFPLDKAPKNKGFGISVRRYLAETIALSLRKEILKQPMGSFSRRYIPALLFWGIFPVKMRKKIQCKVMKWGGKRKAPYYVDLSGTEPLRKLIFPAEWFQSQEKLHFEDGEYGVPKAYAQFLTQLYGDYMTPPPENKRGGHTMDDQFPVIV